MVIYPEYTNTQDTAHKIPTTVTDTESPSFETDTGVKYTPHSMMHKAIVQMDPTKLEMIDGFDHTGSGHKFVPQDSNVRVMLTGRDWSKKRVLIYGSKSSEEAAQYVETIINCINEIGHNADLIEGPTITNIAVSGDLEMSIQLENLSVELSNQGIDIEYEPEQFPAAIVKLNKLEVTFLLFSTGKFVIQGLRGLDDIEPAIRRIQDLITKANTTE